MKARAMVLALALLCIVGCGQPRGIKQSAKEKGPGIPYTWCCHGGLCVEMNPCLDSGPAINCLSCFPTALGCHLNCETPE